jgi:hypothetical protein
MSDFLRLIVGAGRSNTNQFNGILALVWGALLNSDLITTNPEYVTVTAAVSILGNWLLRFKTKSPLSER